MDNQENYLLILRESLDKKIVILNELMEYTENQKDIALKDEFDEEAFNDNVEKKAGLINKLQSLDTGFQILYDNIKEQLSENRDSYKKEIDELQERIRTVLDLNSSLQTLEARNRDLVSKKFASLHKEVRQVKKSQDVAANYYKSSGVTMTEGAHFLDKKK